MVGQARTPVRRNEAGSRRIGEVGNMVKKGSIFGRLAERWRTSGAVKVETGRQAEATSGKAEVARVTPTPAAEERAVRKLSDREEAMVAMNNQFQELTSALRSMHARLDSQLSRLVDSASSLPQLPALSNQQLELLRSMGTQLEKQNALGEQIASTLTSLPPLLQNVELALQRAAQSDERTAAVIREFRGTMDRVQLSMGEMVQHSEQQAKSTRELVDRRESAFADLKTGIEEAQRGTVKELASTTQKAMQSLLQSNEDQSTRLQRVIEQHSGWTKAVLVGVGIAVLGTASTIAVLLLK